MKNLLKKAVELIKPQKTWFTSKRIEPIQIPEDHSVTWIHEVKIAYKPVMDDMSYLDICNLEEFVNYKKNIKRWQELLRAGKKVSATIMIVLFTLPIFTKAQQTFIADDWMQYTWYWKADAQMRWEFRITEWQASMLEKQL